MANIEEKEKDAPSSSPPIRSEDGDHGITITLGGPLRKLSDISRPPDPPQTGLRAAWRRLWETDPPVAPLRLGPGAPWPKVRRFIPSLLTSTLVHSSLVFFLYAFPFALFLRWFMGPPPEARVVHPKMVVYELKHLNLSDYLPYIKPPGAAKAPGRGEKHGPRPPLGATRYDPRISIISNPPHPDNNRLTLKTENAPPKLKMPKDLRIPDLIAGGPGLIPEPGKMAPPPPEKVVPPPPPPTPVIPKSAPSLAKHAAAPPPALKMAAQFPTIASPKLEIPVPPPPVNNTAEAAPAPPTPKVAAPAEASSSAAPAAKPAGGTATDTEKAGGGPKIVALSVDPIPYKDLSQIPKEEHSGAFSIGPAGGAGTGSPGGVPGGKPDAGEGGKGPGGDKSVAVGNGKGPPGGGGVGTPAATPAAPPAVSISGPNSGAGPGAGPGAGTLPPLKAEDLVYPVKPETPKARAPTMMISSSSFGGGGLRVFGVLHGTKIYTVYFSMPIKPWILQYCANEPAPQVDTNSRVVQITIQPPLVPPAVIEQYDYHRPPAPPSAAPAGFIVSPAPVGPTIILHGTIHEDGSVTDLSVVQGLDTLSNDAARSAFSHWKFKPALRGAVPVALEILVGIP